MNPTQTYVKCQYFDIRNACPHRNEELMKQFIMDITPIEGILTTLRLDKAEAINKTYCNICNCFKLSSNQ